MKKEDIKLDDIQRILIGEAPFHFALEVLLRTLIVYIGLIFILKLLGKRMTGQLTITEMAVMIMLGAIVSLPMQSPDRGILQGLLILLLTTALMRGFNYLCFKSKRAELLIQGRVNILVRDGVLDLETLKRLNISKQQLFAVLRNKKITQLGCVSRVYLEACGLFSIYEQQPKPGLPIFPPKDSGLAGMMLDKCDAEVCSNCGTIAQATEVCNVCKNSVFTEAFK